MKTSKINYAAGDVVLLRLDPVRGSESKKTRPCVIVQAGLSPLELIIVLPITDAHNKAGRRLFVPIADLKIAGLSKPSVIDCYQIRTVSTTRVVKVLGRISTDILDAIRIRLALILGIAEQHLEAYL